MWAGDPSADLRALTQDQTDALVRRGLFEAMEVRDYELIDTLARGRQSPMTRCSSIAQAGRAEPVHRSRPLQEIRTQKEQEFRQELDKQQAAAAK